MWGNHVHGIPTDTYLPSRIYNHRQHIPLHPRNTNRIRPYHSSKFQERIIKRHKGFQVLGGVLTPDKCYWFWVEFNCKGNKWGYTPLHRLNGELEIYTSSGEQIPIKKYWPHNSKKALGYLQRLDTFHKTQNAIRKIPNNQVVQGLQGLVWKVYSMTSVPPSTEPN